MSDTELDQIEKDAERATDEIVIESIACTQCASPIEHARRHLMAFYLNEAFAQRELKRLRKEHR